jgi:hypothetical protein
MDVQTIARLARLSPRKIRYVLEHRVMPGMRGRVQEHLAGKPRSFTQMEAFFLALAAVLLDGGIQRKTVAGVLGRLADMPWPLPGVTARPRTAAQSVPRFRSTIAAIYYFATGHPAEVSIGDGVNLCLRLGGVDTGWLEPQRFARLNESYRPSVIIRIDLVPLRTAFVAARTG